MTEIPVTEDVRGYIDAIPPRTGRCSTGCTG
jgi:hypothetical protein